MFQGSERVQVLKKKKKKKEKGPKVVNSCLTKIMVDSDFSQKILVLKES